MKSINSDNFFDFLSSKIFKRSNACPSSIQEQHSNINISELIRNLFIFLNCGHFSKISYDTSCLDVLSSNSFNLSFDILKFSLNFRLVSCNYAYIEALLSQVPANLFTYPIGASSDHGPSIRIVVFCYEVSLSFNCMSIHESQCSHAHTC
jgi:hypothetical protein